MQDVRAACMKVGILRTERQSSIATRERFFESPDLLQRMSAIAVCLSVIRLDTDGSVETSDRPFDGLAAIAECCPG